MTDLHPFKCPGCEEAIRATNIEYLYDDAGNGTVVSSRVRSFPATWSLDSEKEQLYYCPNEDCRVERLTPGDSE